MEEFYTTIEKDLLQIFSRYEKSDSALAEIATRGRVYPKLEKKNVLFIGINPSYLNDAKPESFSYDVKKAVINYPQHYRKFQTLALNSGIGDNWTYLDLFYFRETEQKMHDEILKDENGLKFICEQLQITQSIIEKLRPEVIVVCNNGARKFFGVDKEIDKEGNTHNVWMGYKFEFNDKFGVDVITGIHSETINKGTKTTALIGVPVVFASTLTYMDISSKKRLEWQLGKVYNYRNTHFNFNYKLTDSNRLTNIFNDLLKQYREAKKSKNEAIKDQKYDVAVQLREKENGKLLEILEQVYSELI